MAGVATYSNTSIIGENEEQLVTMIVDDQLFGIPILQVQDIVEASNVTPVPMAPSAIAGVLNLRGRIVTVIDLRKLLGNDEEVPWKSQMGVTVEFKGDLYTLLVDAIGDVRTLPKRDFDKAPSTMEDKLRKICLGIYRLRGNLLVVLDVSRILLPEAIEATPMLSVEDRRARKEAAVAADDQVKSEKGHRIAALMTDLNAYESDFDSGLESLSGDDDDIKARKRANRARRPVSERWREVLEEKARRDGATVYRMREPEEEILEEARDDAEQEDATWEAELQARQTGTYQSRLPEPEDRAGDLSGSDQPAPASDAVPADPAPIDSAGTDAPQASDPPSAEAETESPSGRGSVVSGWWSKLRGKPGERGAEESPVESPAAEESAVEPPAADASPETPVADEPSVASEPPLTGEPPAAYEPVAADEPPLTDEPVAPDELLAVKPPRVVTDEPAAADEPAAETAPAGNQKAKAGSGTAGKKAKKGSSSKSKAKTSASRSKAKTSGSKPKAGTSGKPKKK